MVGHPPLERALVEIIHIHLVPRLAIRLDDLQLDLFDHHLTLCQEAGESGWRDSNR